MISLGIFGDSYVTPSTNKTRDYSWIYHLPGYKSTTYGMCGTSVFYSYQKFLEHHHKHEKNIFCVTESRRYPDNIIKSDCNQIYATIPTYFQAEELLKNSLYKKSHNKIKILKDLYLYFDNDFLKTFNELMLAHVKSIRPDTLIISCYWNFNKNHTHIFNSAGDNSLTIQSYQFNMIESILKKSKYIPVSPGPISKKDVERHKIYYDIMIKPETENLTCHLSKEMNQLLANDVRNALELNIWNPTPLEYVPHEQDLSFYYDLKK